jgi:hypothetical protein
MTFDEVVQALGSGAESVAKIRALTAGRDDLPIDEAVRITLAQRDARIAELQTQIDAGSVTPTPVPAPTPTPPPAPVPSPTPPSPLEDRFDLVSFTDFRDQMPGGWYAYSRSRGNEGVGWRDRRRSASTARAWSSPRPATHRVPSARA